MLYLTAIAALSLLSIVSPTIKAAETLDQASTKLPIITKIPGQELTQTQAYLSVPAMRARAEQLISDLEGIAARDLKEQEDSGLAEQAHSLDIASYLSLIPDIIRQEVALKDHDVFYHGQPGDFVFFYDIVKEVEQWLALREHTPNFQYLRPQSTTNVKQSVGQFLNAALSDEMTGEEKAAFDETHKNLLLSVNLSLLANSGHPNESSFVYFLSSYSAFAKSDPLLKQFFQHFGFKQEYLEKLLALAKQHRKGAEKGNLLQIFIPRDKVNDHVYLSSGFGGLPVGMKSNYSNLFDNPVYAPGLPIKITDAEGTVREYDLRTMLPRTYLDIYRTNPEAIDPEDLDIIEGRILLTTDFLTYSPKGVKVYWYNFITIDNPQEYQQEFKRIISQMMLDWLTAPSDKFLKERHQLAQQALEQYPRHTSSPMITISHPVEPLEPTDKPNARDFWKRYKTLQKTHRKDLASLVTSSGGYLAWKKELFEKVEKYIKSRPYLSSNLLATRWSLDSILSDQLPDEDLYAYNYLREVNKLAPKAFASEIDREWLHTQNLVSLNQLLTVLYNYEDTQLKKTIYLLNAILEPDRCFGDPFTYLFKDSPQKDLLISQMRLIAYNKLRSIYQAPQVQLANQVNMQWVQEKDYQTFKHVIDTSPDDIPIKPKSFLARAVINPDDEEFYELRDLAYAYNFCGQKMDDRLMLHAYNLLRQLHKLPRVSSVQDIDINWVKHLTKKGKGKAKKS